MFAEQLAGVRYSDDIVEILLYNTEYLLVNVAEVSNRAVVSVSD